MATSSSRIFVGNLPHEVTRDEVANRFKKYGKVESVEIKTKKDATDQVMATFCYVNLNTDSDSLNQCILFLNGFKWGARNIKVEVAKESFLQRLQRERQASNNTTATKQSSFISQVQTSSGSPPKTAAKEKAILRKKPVVSKKVESSSESSDSEDEADVHPTSKLRMFKGISSLAFEEPQPSPSLNIEEGSLPKTEPKKELSTLEIKKSKYENTNKDTNHFDPRRDSFSSQNRFSSKNENLNTGNRDKKLKNNDKTSDLLKKFESFSDVWRDTDEPTESFNGRGSRKSRNEEFSSSKSSGFKNEWPNNRQSIGRESNKEIMDQPVSSSINAAEEKRLKSIEEKRQAFEQQKRAVQLALSDKSAPRVNKKVVFDDNDDNDFEEPAVPEKRPKLDITEEMGERQNRKSKVLSLFEDDDEEEEGGEDKSNWSSEFQVKKQFEGQKGKKLLDLQSRFNNDERFKLDERFYESDDDESKNKTDSKEESSKTGQTESIEGLAEERDQQLQILSSIIGKPIAVSHAHAQAQQESKTKGMLRFDPTKPNHSRFELAKEPKESKKKKKSKAADLEKKDDEDEDEVEANNPSVRREEKEPEPVSQNKFYSVSDTLAETLKLSKEGQGSGFSLLQMFGSSESSSAKQEKFTEAKTSKKELKRKPIAFEDSSSDEEDSESRGPTAGVTSEAQISKTTQGVRSTGGIWQQSFFFAPNDDRLKEGADFFAQTELEDPEKFAKKRQALKKIMKHKLKNSNRKANSFRTKVSTLRKKASLYSSGGQKQRRKQRK